MNKSGDTSTQLFFKREHLKKDGRKLYIYGIHEHTLSYQDDKELLADLTYPHLRWHPLRQEWVCYATHRQDRTFRPDSEYCPFCPARENGVVTEIPFSDFEVAVFENRFPAFLLEPHISPELFIKTKPAIGLCEIILYSANHNDSWITMSQSRLELIVNVWKDRYQDMLKHEGIQFVMPFENKGEEIGATLTHPHGQIYYFSYIPPVVEKMAKGFRNRPVLQDLIKSKYYQYDIFIDDYVIAYVPPFQRYPYELWLTTRQFHPSLCDFSKQEVSSFARTIGMICKLYDVLFDKPMPYIMILYSSPKGEEEYFQFHAQFLPFMRSIDKIKYLAGCETGAGTFLSDSLPEESVYKLRSVLNRLYK